MRIGDAARAAGVGVETIRYYERRGLIARPARPVRGGARSYSKEAIARIRFIREAQSIGFSLREIKELASLELDPDADCGEVKARAKAKLDEVNRKIAGLGAMRMKLEQVLVACPGRGRLDQCAILAALSTGGGGIKRGEGA